MSDMSFEDTKSPEINIFEPWVTMDQIEFLKSVIGYLAELETGIRAFTPGMSDQPRIEEIEALRIEASAWNAAINATMNRLIRGCTRAGKPSDLVPTPDANGNLVYACGHNPQHLYDLNGKPLN